MITSNVDHSLNFDFSELRIDDASGQKLLLGNSEIKFFNVKEIPENFKKNFHIYLCKERVDPKIQALFVKVLYNSFLGDEQKEIFFGLSVNDEGEINKKFFDLFHVYCGHNDGGFRYRYVRTENVPLVSRVKSVCAVYKSDYPSCVQWLEEQASKVRVEDRKELLALVMKYGSFNEKMVFLKKVIDKKILYPISEKTKVEVEKLSSWCAVLQSREVDEASQLLLWGMVLSVLSITFLVYLFNGSMPTAEILAYSLGGVLLVPGVMGVYGVSMTVMGIGAGIIALVDHREVKKNIETWLEKNRQDLELMPVS